MGLFKKKNGRAIAFIDYEFWSSAVDNVYGMRPDIESFDKLISSRYDVAKKYYFGRFTLPALEAEANAIRASGGEAVDSQDVDRIRGDRSDTVMMEYIFKTMTTEKNIDTVIIFTPDNQFMSVVSFLKERLGKKIVLCSVKRTLGARFKLLADDIIEVPGDEVPRKVFYDMIVDNFRYIYRHKDKAIYPTFLSTITTVARLNDVAEEDIRNALQELIDKKILFKAEVTVNQGENSIRVLRLDKLRAQKGGLYMID
jgi:hypothetical protein